MALQFNQKSKGSLVVSQRYQFRHYGNKSQPLTFTANTPGSTVALAQWGSYQWVGSYSTNGTTWNEYIPNTTGSITLTNVGDQVQFKGDILGAFADEGCMNFQMTGSIAASGNINSMYVSTGFDNLNELLYQCCYQNLFRDCTSLTTAPELPATILHAQACYHSMFYGCTSLTTAPELPATVLINECYAYMFQNCTSLITPPMLPATELSPTCYHSMFDGCESLTYTPTLPATVVEYGSYQNMFGNCTSLWSVSPILATTLNYYSCEQMFSGCTSLYDPPQLLSTNLANWCYKEMFSGCTSLFRVPKLSATTLAYECYKGMFKDCTRLRVSDSQTSLASCAWRIPTSGTFTNTYEQQQMFTNCMETRASNNLPGVAGASYTYYTDEPPI